MGQQGEAEEGRNAGMPQYGNKRLNNAAANELDRRAKLAANRARYQFRAYLEQSGIAPTSYYNALELKMMRAVTLSDILTRLGFDANDPSLYWEDETDEQVGYGRELMQRFQEQETEEEPEPVIDAAFQDLEPTRGDLMDQFLQNVDHSVLTCVIARLGLEARVTQRATYLERVSETVTVADNTQTIGLRRLEEALTRCANTVNPR
jgi:hypothetical protein